MQEIFNILVGLSFLFIRVQSQQECTVTSQNGNTAFRINYDDTTQEFELFLQDNENVMQREVLVINHTQASAAINVGSGTTTFTEYRGNFDVTDYTSEKIPLPYFEVEAVNDGPLSPSVCTKVTFRNIQTTDTSVSGLVEVYITFNEAQNLSLNVEKIQDGSDRIWIRFASSADEHIYGGGEQFTHFDLKGKSFPIWTREQGVGRDKTTNMTFLADTRDGGAGGDYHTTYWPQPLFYSDQLYSVCMTSSRYSIFDFTQDEFHEIEVWQSDPIQFDFQIGSNWADITTKTADYLLDGMSRPTVPEWTYKGGAILGLQGGTDIVLGLYDQAVQNGVKVTGLWIQDWVGHIQTSFGTRLFWDWKLNEEQYPGIRDVMQQMAQKGVYFMAYINPYLNKEGELFKTAENDGFLVKDKNGNSHVSDFGEFYCGTVDLTKPEAFAWYKGIIQTNLIDTGFRGWMADFGEYLPVDEMVFADGRTGDELHNLWPSLWAQVNREAIEGSNVMGEIFVWMRAGHTASSKYTISAWAGDQNVDWSFGDGLPSVIPAALSLGMSGVGISHFDIGGFTSLYGVVRTEELLLRSSELAVFTPSMRTHEGNRPTDNVQVYSSDYILTRFGRLSKLHEMLGNYTESLIQDYYTSSMPLQRPLFFEFPDDLGCYDDLVSKYQYMYGPDLLVAPIYTEGAHSRIVYLPLGETWMHLWQADYIVDTTQASTNETVPAPMGEPPVFYRNGSAWADLFRSFGNERAMIYPPVQHGSMSTPATVLILVVTILTSYQNFIEL